jgi:putative IMPACT (imprinted ancient) family translation regulator
MGTAGKPILGQIDSKSIINVAVIVVRYFGGTLLGVPGLINAYKTATSLALQLTPIVQKQIEIIYSLEFDYTQMNKVMTIIKQFNCTILQQEMQLFCILKIGVPKNREAEVMYSLKELKGVEIKVI